MTALTYGPARSGGWLALAADDRLLVVAAPAEAGSLADELFAAISDEAGFQLALDVLTRNGLAATPSFVLVERSDAATTRIIVRGAASAVVTGADGEHPLSGAGVSTWAERAIAGFAGLTVDVPGAEPVGSVMLPLAHGAAWVSSIRMLADGAALPRAQRPAAIAPPTPAPAPPAPPAAAPVTTPVVQPPPAPAAPAAVSEATVTDALASYGETETDANGDAHLVGETMVRPVAQAAVHAPAPDDAAEPDGEAESDTGIDAVAGDHDGHTVMSSDIAALRAGRARGAAPTPTTPAQVPAFVLELSTGQRERLDQPILLGRSPSVSQVSGVRLPRLVTVGDVDQDISRNHAQFALEGDTVVVTDLHSRNGTLIRLPGKEQQKLRAGEPTAILVGTVVDFGSGITLTVGEA